MSFYKHETRDVEGLSYSKDPQGSHFRRRRRLEGLGLSGRHTTAGTRAQKKREEEQISLLSKVVARA